MGLKRQCLSCAAKFYDLAKNPILCPKCGTTFEPVLFARSPPRRVGRMFSATPGPFETQAEAAVEPAAERSRRKAKQTRMRPRKTPLFLMSKSDRRERVLISGVGKSRPETCFNGR